MNYNDIPMDLVREIKIWWIEFFIFVVLVLGVLSVLAYKNEQKYIKKSKTKKPLVNQECQSGKMYNFIVEDRVVQKSNKEDKDQIA